MAKKSGSGINIGSVSILVIFVLLCLTTFATLSLVSANADAKLTNATADSLSEFYEADAISEETLALIDAILIKHALAPNEQSYFSLCANDIDSLDGVEATISSDRLAVEYKVSINEKRELFMALDILYPKTSNDKRYKITKWQAVQTVEWESDDSLTLWDGTL